MNEHILEANSADSSYQHHDYEPNNQNGTQDGNVQYIPNDIAHIPLTWLLKSEFISSDYNRPITATLPNILNCHTIAELINLNKETIEKVQGIGNRKVQEIGKETLDIGQTVQPHIYNNVGSNNVDEPSSHHEKSAHQQPPVQMTMFDLWGMEEEDRLTTRETKKQTGKAAATTKPSTKKTSKKKSSPLVKTVNPTAKFETKPLENKEKSADEAKGNANTPEVEARKILPGDEPYANISWEENPPINGFYELMMTMTPEDRVTLRQKQMSIGRNNSKHWVSPTTLNQSSLRQWSLWMFSKPRLDMVRS